MPVAQDQLALTAGFEMMPGEPHAGSAEGHLAAAADCKSKNVVKDDLKAFTADLHTKAATITAWISNLEPPTTPCPTAKMKKSRSYGFNFVSRMQVHGGLPDGA